MSWLDLPVEIKLQIVTSLDRDDRKGFRLTSKANANLIEQKLFHTIHVTPNTRSFDRARNVAGSPHLSRYVRSLVYHLGILDDVHNGYPNFRDDIMRLHHPNGSTADITEDILWQYNCFLEEMDGQRDFDTRDASEEFKFLAQHFQSLESITTILDENDPFTVPDDFIGRRTGVHTVCPADGAHLSSLFNAMVGKRLTSMYGRSASWQCLPFMFDALEKVDMSNMKELALGLFNSEFLELLEGDKTQALKALDILFAKTITADTLLLDFDEIPFEYEYEDNDLHEISKVLFKHHWPLRNLTLQGIVATESEIVDFLDKHSASLRRLTIGDIGLQDETDRSSDGTDTLYPGSIIVLFRRISETLQLERVAINGCFSNGCNESWYVDSEWGDENCLRRKIERWLCRQGPSPFPTSLTHRKRLSREEFENGLFSPTGPVDLSEDSHVLYAAAGWEDRSWNWDMDRDWDSRNMVDYDDDADINAYNAAIEAMDEDELDELYGMDESDEDSEPEVD